MRGKFLSRIRVNSVLLIMLPLLFITSLPAVSATYITPTNDSAYETLGYVTYNIQLTYETSGGGSFNLEVYVPRWKNWSAEVTEDTHSLQESTIQNATPDGYSEAYFDQSDGFNNSIDYYKSSGTRFTLTMNYTLTVKQVRWNNLGTHSMDEYDTGSAFYNLYTEDQPDFIHVSDPNIQGNASQICGTENNPVEKARKIYEWVSKNIYYEMQTGGGGTAERGASWALTNKKGDCSEYSDLMVAMLRAEGVPARKVVGIAMLQDDGSPISSFTNKSSWYYLYYYKSYPLTTFNNLTGHAWVEYYVPGAGWVSCDPTWGINRTDNFYFNYNDHLHITSAKGEYFGDEVYPPFSEIGEYPALPYQIYTDLDIYRLIIRVTVLDNHEWVDATALIWIVSILIVISVIAIIYWAGSGRRHKNATMNEHLY